MGRTTRELANGAEQLRRVSDGELIATFWFVPQATASPSRVLIPYGAFHVWCDAPSKRAARGAVERLLAGGLEKYAPVPQEKKKTDERVSLVRNRLAKLGCGPRSVGAP